MDLYDKSENTAVDKELNKQQNNMQYPLISEYVKAIQDAGDNLEQLAYLTPVLDDHGEPYRSSGAFAVVFKMLDSISPLQRKVLTH